MLQWMGGSRQKVTATRRSKQKRQKQYFEQRKRQQRQHETSSLENFVDGFNAITQNQKEKRSLDVMSLHSLSKVAEAGSSDCLYGACILEANPSPEKYPKTRTMPESINKIVTPTKNVENRKTGSCSINGGKRMPHEELRNDTSKLFNSTSKNGNAEEEQPKKSSADRFEGLSVFELIEEDGTSKSEDSTGNEAHVAFSVEGLGKMGSETPVHSPQPRSRTLSDGQPCLFKASKYQHAPKNFDVLPEDHEVDVESIAGDDMPFTGKYLNSDFGQSGRFGLPGHAKHNLMSFYDNIKPHAVNSHVNLFDDKESFYGAQKLHSDFLDGIDGSPFPDGISFNEKIDTPWGNGCSTDIFNAGKTHEPGFLEDLGFPERDRYGTSGRFCDSDISARYPKHEVAVDYDFINSDRSKCFLANEFSAAGARPSHRSYLLSEDPIDDLGTLSGESCSSSAVWGNGIEKNSAFGQPSTSTKFTPGQRREYEKPGTFTRPPYDPYPPRPVHADFPDPLFTETSDHINNWLRKENDAFPRRIVTSPQHTNHVPFHHPSDRHFLREDTYGLFSAPGFQCDPPLSYGGCKDVSSAESAPSIDSRRDFDAFAQSSDCTKNFRNAKDGMNFREKVSATENRSRACKKNMEDGSEWITRENANETSSFVNLADKSPCKANETGRQDDALTPRSQQPDPDKDVSGSGQSVASEEDGIEPSYQLMMLESHMLHLLRVKKGRKSARMEEILRRV